MIDENMTDNKKKEQRPRVSSPSTSTKVKLKYGDKVRFKWDLGYGSPGLMMVLRESREFGRITNNELVENERDNRKLLGLRCMWFSSLGEVIEGTFSTKDLVKVTGSDLAKFECGVITNSGKTFNK